jgi:uncharacterized membrane protein
MTILRLSLYWLIAPVLFIVAGLLLTIKPPNKINELYGYRTKRSKKSIIHWNLAQKIAGIYLLTSGIILTIIAVLMLVLVPEKNIFNPFLVLGMILFQLLQFIIMIILVETRLKKLETKEI